MPKRRRRSGGAAPLTEGIAHFLAAGCYLSGDLESFKLGGAVIRGDFGRLRTLWTAHAGELRPLVSRPWAARVLAGDPTPPSACHEHRAAMDQAAVNSRGKGDS